jgi:hypothetical protein
VLFGALVGLVLVGVGAVLSVVRPVGRASSPGVESVGMLLLVVALAGVLWKIRGSLDDASDRTVPWADGAAFATPAPERADDSYPLSSDGLGRQIRAAGEVARSERSVEDGVAEIRPVLRATLLDALVQGRREKEAVRRELASGDWTDDRVAASVLDPAVSPPSMSLRERLTAWLSPERTVRRRSQRAVQAVAEVADEALLTVPGQTAPRTRPVVRPGLGELQRGADGHLQRAVDREVVARGPDPPDPTEPDPGTTDERPTEPESAGAGATGERPSGPAERDAGTAPGDEEVTEP